MNEWVRNTSEMILSRESRSTWKKNLCQWYSVPPQIPNRLEVKQLFVGSESDVLQSESCSTVESTLNPLTVHLQQAKKKISLSKLLSQVWMPCNQMRVWRPVFESDWKLPFFSSSFEWKQNPVNEIRRKYPVILRRPDYRDQVYCEVLYAVQISNFAVSPTPRCKTQYFLCGADQMNICFVFRYTWPLPLFRKQ